MTPKKQILVVEDNQLNREMLMEILAEQYAVLGAENGQEALELGAVALRGQDLHPELRPFRLALHFNVHGRLPLSALSIPGEGGSVQCFRTDGALPEINGLHRRKAFVMMEAAKS